MPLQYVQTNFYVAFPNKYRSGQMLYRRVYYDSDSPRDCYIYAKDCQTTLPAGGKLVDAHREWHTDHVLSDIEAKTTRQFWARCRQGYYPIAYARNPKTEQVYYVSQYHGSMVDVAQTTEKICALFERHPFVRNNRTSATIQRMFVEQLCRYGGALQDARTDEHKKAGLICHEIVFNQDSFDFAIWLYPKLIEKMAEKDNFYSGLTRIRECFLFFMTLCLADKGLHDTSYDNKSHIIILDRVLKAIGFRNGCFPVTMYLENELKKHNLRETDMLKLLDWDIPVDEYAMQFKMDEGEATSSQRNRPL